MSDRQRVTIDVRVLLTHGSKVLLLQRSDSLFPGRWNLPGGHVATDENAMHAALRELKEEAGVTVLPRHLRYSAVCHYRIPGRGPKVGFAFVATRWSGVPQVAEADKFSAIEWHSVDRLPNLLMPHAAEMIQLYTTGIAFSAYGWDQRVHATEARLDTQ